MLSTSYYGLGFDGRKESVEELAEGQTSPTSLIARDHYTSSTLIGGEGGGAPRWLRHTTLEGPTEYVNAIWV